MVNEQLSFSLTHSQDNAAKGLLDLYELNLPAYIRAVHFHGTYHTPFRTW